MQFSVNKNSSVTLSITISACKEQATIVNALRSAIAPYQANVRPFHVSFAPDLASELESESESGSDDWQFESDIKCDADLDFICNIQGVSLILLDTIDFFERNRDAMGDRLPSVYPKNDKTIRAILDSYRVDVYATHNFLSENCSERRNFLIDWSPKVVLQTLLVYLRDYRQEPLINDNFFLVSKS